MEMKKKMIKELKNMNKEDLFKVEPKKKLTFIDKLKILFGNGK